MDGWVMASQAAVRGSGRGKEMGRAEEVMGRGWGDDGAAAKMVRILAATCGAREVECWYAGVKEESTYCNSNAPGPRRIPHPALNPPPILRVDGREEPDEPGTQGPYLLYFTVCTHAL